MQGQQKLRGNHSAARRGLSASGTWHCVVKNKRRRGWSLLELMVTMMLVTAMTGASVKILASLLRSERSGVEHVTRLTTVSRIARQFRADVHAATDLQLAANPQLLMQMTSGDQRQIQYQLHPQGLLRTEQRPSQTLVSKDLLRLQGSRFRIEESSAPPRLMTLFIETPDVFATDVTQPSNAARELRVDAIFGRDYRDY